MGEQNSRRRLPSPSMIVAGVALFVSLGGGAYAGVAFNQVRSAHIKNGEVKTVDLANAAVTSAKVRNGAVTAPKIANGAVTLAKIQPAARNAMKGNAGPQGPKGETGATGAAGAAAGFVTDSAGLVQFPAAAGTYATAVSRTVPAGSYVVTAATTANNNAGSTADVECRLVGGATPFATTAYVVLSANGAGGERESITTAGGVSLPGGGTISLECKSSGTSGNYLSSKITAIQVNQLNP